MNVRGPHDALADMKNALADIATINHCIAAIQILQMNGTDSYNTHLSKGYSKSTFNYVEFVLSDQFSIENHFRNNKNRIWPYLKNAFSEAENIDHGFSAELFALKEGEVPSEEKKIKIAKAIILWGVGAELEFNYIAQSADILQQKLSVSDPDKHPAIIMDDHAQALTISKHNALHGQLTVIMELVDHAVNFAAQNREFLECSTKTLDEKIETSDADAAIKSAVKEIRGTLLDLPYIFDITKTTKLLNALEKLIENPTEKHAKNCNDIGKSLSTTHEKFKEPLRIIKLKLLQIECVAKTNAKTSGAGLFSDKSTDNETNKKHRPDDPLTPPDSPKRRG